MIKKRKRRKDKKNMASYKVELLTSPDDAPIIGRIKTEAFETSTVSRYSFLWEGNGKSVVEKWYIDREVQDLQSPNQYTIISVSVTEGTVVNGDSTNTSAGSPEKSQNKSDRNATGNNWTVAAWARFAIPRPMPKAVDGMQEEPEYKKQKQYLMDNPPSGNRPELFNEFRKHMQAARQKYLDESRDYGMWYPLNIVLYFYICVHI